MSNLYIPDSFKKVVLSHILKNGIAEAPEIAWLDLDFPLYLFVQGPKGEGKSSMIYQVCKGANKTPIQASASSLAGSTEKASVDAFLDVYNKASKANTVLLIDDFHLGIASKNKEENVGTTANSDLLTGAMMNMADNYQSYCNQNHFMNVRRVPIFITVNSTTDIYAPLIRHGRADIYNWIPNLEEKRDIVKHIFEPYFEDERQLNGIDNLVGKYKDQSIAFFKQLKSDMMQDVFNTLLSEININNYDYRQVCSIVIKMINDKSEQFTIEELFELAKTRFQMKTNKFE